MRCVTILSISFIVLLGVEDALATSSRGKRSNKYQRIGGNGRCVLPRQPIGGKFEIDSCTGRSCNRTSGEKVASGTFLAFSCDEGYALKGNEFTGCRKGEWYLPPTCVKTCPPLTSRSVDIVYEFQCNGASRDSIIFPGTKATLNCKPFYEIHQSNEPGYRSVTCLKGGEWDRPLFDCTAECGKAGGYALIAGGFEAKGAEFPWHVGIYRESEEDDWEQICGGTLVKPDLVVSAAHCFYDETMKKVRSVSRFVVAAGKTYRSYSRREHSEQKSSVKEIDIPKKYYGVDVKYALDIAFVRTTTSFTYTGSVRPICIDVDNRNNDLNRTRIGKVAGWGIADDDKPSIKLRKIELPYIPHEDCFDKVPPDFRSSVFVDDKFCAGYLNGSSVCQGDSGGGLSFESNGLWYLRGIVSIGPRTQINDIVCVSDSYTVFTNVSKHLEWIRSRLVRSAAKGRTFCTLPEKPLNGGFERDSRLESHVSVPEGEVPNGGSLVFRCDEGFTLEGSIDSTCENGAWSRLAPICAGKCQPLQVPKNGDVVCKFKGDAVPCESDMDAGTQATMTCTRFYQISGEHNSTHRDILCNEDGEWDPRVPQCVPECGRLVDENHFNDEARFPWNVRIYYRKSDTAYANLDGGTLVSPDLVITRHPLSFEGFLNSGLGVHVYAGGSGNLNYEMSSRVRDLFAVNSFTYKLLEETPYPFRSVTDIAILRLATPFTMTTLVRPVCIDWGHGYEPDDIQSEKNLAFVVSKEGTKIPNVSPYLVDRKPTFMPRDVCRSMVRAFYEAKASRTLAGLRTGLQDDLLDGGYGIFSESNGIWYLRGAQFDGTLDYIHHPTYVLYNVGSYIDGIRSVFIQSAISAPMVNQSLA